MQKYLILLAGSPATGKSYLIEAIKEVVPNIFIVTPDELKEDIADSTGFANLQAKDELEIDVWKTYYGILELYMSIGKQFILSEYPFSEKQKKRLADYAEKYGYQVITIRLDADFEVLWERRRKRDIENSRHLSHISTHYHFGDVLEDRTQADHLITKDKFKKIIDEREYNKFSLGELYEFDVTDFNKVDYTELLNMLKKLANQ